MHAHECSEKVSVAILAQVKNFRSVFFPFHDKVILRLVLWPLHSTGQSGQFGKVSIGQVT